MACRTDMTREHAALLLGVDESASADDVQRAWKVWVRLAHPDAGGEDVRREGRQRQWGEPDNEAQNPQQ